MLRADFKTGRGRGGLWENIIWENIYGNFATALFGFGENHGTGYNQSLGPTNATGTPVIKNLLIKDVVLTDVMAPSMIFTLAEQVRAPPPSPCFLLWLLRLPRLAFGFGGSSCASFD